MSTTCPECRAKVLPDQAECTACGEPLPDPEEGPDPFLGATIADNYRIDELIGEGSMGRVYAARQISLDKPVAIKVLHKHLAADPKVAKRFHREARAASRLSHPNSLQIIDFGAADDGTLFIAMERLDGPDLLTVIEEGHPLSPRRIQEILSQVLSALEEAHHAGIIHRDLKPENVVVMESPSGRVHVKVCDFGIAKIQESDGGSGITVSGFVCGTPEFMAPEQARGEELDPRADVYAAGCMLYQMLTGEMPFQADSALGIITQHLTEAPIPPHLRAPDIVIPPVLEELCLRAMDKDREARVQSAAALREELEQAVRSLGETAEEPMRQRGEDEPLPSPAAGDGRRGADGGAGSTVVPAAGPRPLPWRWLAIGTGAAVVALLAWLVWSPGDRSGAAEGQGAAAETLAGAGPASEGQAGTPAAQSPASPTALGAAADGGLATALGATEPDAGAADERAGETSTAEGGEPDATREQRARAAARARNEAGRRQRQRAAAQQRAQEPEPTEGDGEPAEPEASPGEQAFAEGRRLFLQNDVARAIDKFEQAARQMPGNAGVHKQLGRAYMRSGQVQRGITAYRRYLELAPEAPDRAIVEQIIRSN